MSFSMAGGVKEGNYIAPCKNKKVVTLQVRIPCAGTCHVKKAFPSVSAGMTLEAALALTLFLFASVSLILPMKILTTERRVQAALEAVGEDFSRYAYIQDMLERGEIKAVPGADEFAKGFCQNLGAGIAQGYAQAQVMRHMDTGQARSVRMLRSSIRADGETFDLVVDYEIRMPFPVLGLDSIPRTARSCRRAWIGKAGGSGGEAGNGGEDEDETVYVGRDSTRYHRDRGCHYLSNSMTAVPYGQVDSRRNESGGKYHACAACGRGAGVGSTVYIMPSGNSYHTTRNCTAILAYVRAVRLSQVEYMGPCSYCSR